MENVTFLSLDKYYSYLNYLYSINFTILDCHHSFNNNRQKIFDASYIFREKSFSDTLFEGEINNFAEQRNAAFRSLNEHLDSIAWIDIFNQSITCLVSSYNETFNQNIAFEDIASNDNIINMDLFKKIINTKINDNDTSSENLEKTAIFNFVKSEVISFYEQYQQWVVIKEIIQCLSHDINEYGAKSLYYNISQNKNIKLVSIEEINKIRKVLSSLFKQTTHKYYALYNKMMKISSKNYDDNSASYSELSKTFNDISLKQFLLANALKSIDVLYERANSANKNIGNLSARLNNLIFRIKSACEDRFSVDQIYVHNIEAKNIIKSISKIPELQEFSEYWFSIFGAQDVNKSNIKQ